MANPRESEFRNRGGERERDEYDELFEIGKMGSLFSPMLYGFNREQEMSVMVSALAHVVAGVGEAAAGGSGSGGGSSSACKRGREEQQQSSLPQHYAHFPLGNMGASNSFGIYTITNINVVVERPFFYYAFSI